MDQLKTWILKKTTKTIEIQDVYITKKFEMVLEQNSGHTIDVSESIVIEWANPLTTLNFTKYNS